MWLKKSRWQMLSWIPWSNSAHNPNFYHSDAGFYNCGFTWPHRDTFAEIILWSNHTDVWSTSEFLMWLSFPHTIIKTIHPTTRPNLDLTLQTQSKSPMCVSSLSIWAPIRWLNANTFCLLSLWTDTSSLPSYLHPRSTLSAANNQSVSLQRNLTGKRY
jgi:hypothetical protein